MSTPDQDFRPLIAALARQMVVLTDQTCQGRTGDPANMKVCKHGTWNTRRLIETVLSMLTPACPLRKVGHRQADYFWAHLAFVVAAFNIGGSS